MNRIVNIHESGYSLKIIKTVHIFCVATLHVGRNGFEYIYVICIIICDVQGLINCSFDATQTVLRRNGTHIIPYTLLQAAQNACSYIIGITQQYSIESRMDEAPTAIQLNRRHCSFNKDVEYVTVLV